MGLSLNLVELAAVASLLSALFVLFGLGGSAGPGWSKDPITVPGLLAGAFLGCVISAFWSLLNRELNSKRYYKDQAAELKVEHDNAMRGLLLLQEMLVTNGIDLPKTGSGSLVPPSKSTSKSPARSSKRTRGLTRSVSEGSDVSATENGDSLGNKFG